MRLRLTVPGQTFSSVSEKLNEWKSSIVSKEESEDELSVGRLEILAISVHAEGETNVDLYDDHEEPPSNFPEASTGSDFQQNEKLHKQTISEKKADPMGDVKQSKCNAYVIEGSL
ncbi:hypothetical protein POM88_034035 [Heracleum sosnowskyi]|uniref:Uncharacterized protein n=1 Tax=Heracleum sosnowskyi TaxID=360622 RepID=A0AAD8HJM7_9APIA|nr:hypothetical protein POM88_034035 [Heracleum sosnowskyi]